MSNNTEDRKFKGVWIPKEIWLSKDLSMLEKVLLVEIDSLDNENHCIAGNEYFAEFCNCSTATITRAVSHLKDLGYIEELPYNGKYRTLRVIKMISQTNQNDESDSSKRLANNIYNKLDNSNTFTNVKVAKPTVAPKRKSLVTSVNIANTVNEPKKKNKYQNCMDITDEIFEDIELRKILSVYLPVRLAMKDKPIFADGWRRLLNTLKDMADDNETRIKIVEQSIDNGWGKFVRLKKYDNYNNRKKFAEGKYGLKLTKANTEEDLGEIF